MIPYFHPTSRLPVSNRPSPLEPGTESRSQEIIDEGWEKYEGVSRRRSRAPICIFVRDGFIFRPRTSFSTGAPATRGIIMRLAEARPAK